MRKYINIVVGILLIALAFCLARFSAGNSIAARMPMMAITTKSSIKVNARPGAADLALVEPDGIDDTFDSGLKISLGEHDKR